MRQNVLGNGARAHSARLGLRGQQRIDLRAQRQIVRARLIEERAAGARLAPARRVKDRGDLPPAFRRHDEDFRTTRSRGAPAPILQAENRQSQATGHE
jgi:hypothetical protein